jgi:hypothetical protein
MHYAPRLGADVRDIRNGELRHVVRAAADAHRRALAVGELHVGAHLLAMDRHKQQARDRRRMDDARHDWSRAEALAIAVDTLLAAGLAVQARPLATELRTIIASARSSSALSSHQQAAHVG